MAQRVDHARSSLHTQVQAAHRMLWEAEANICQMADTRRSFADWRWLIAPDSTGDLLSGSALPPAGVPVPQARRSRTSRAAASGTRPAKGVRDAGAGKGAGRNAIPTWEDFTEDAVANLDAVGIAAGGDLRGPRNGADGPLVRGHAPRPRGLPDPAQHQRPVHVGGRLSHRRSPRGHRRSIGDHPTRMGDS